MSSFFNNLARRTLGIIPAPRPALAPLFAVAPVLPATDMLLEGEQQEAVTTEQEKSIQFAPQPIVAQREGENPPSNLKEERTNNAAANLMPQEMDSASASPGQPRHESFISTPQKSGDQFLTTPSLQAPTSTLLESAFAPSPLQSLSHEQSTLPFPPSSEQKRQRETSPLQTQTTSTRWSGQHARQSEPASTVQITIGRIEVRAVHAPAAHNAKAPPVPRTSQPSLEAYLQARNRGKP